MSRSAASTKITANGNAASETIAESHAYQRRSRRARRSASTPPPSEPMPPATAAMPPNARPVSPGDISNTRRR